MRFKYTIFFGFVWGAVASQQTNTDEQWEIFVKGCPVNSAHLGLSLQR